MERFEWYRKAIGGHWYFVRVQNGVDCPTYWTKHPHPADTVLDFVDYFGRL
jgi:hypothetical protein